MSSKAGVRMLAALVLLISAAALLDFVRGGPLGIDDLRPLRHFLLALLGVAAAVGLWGQRRWGAILLLVFAIMAILNRVLILERPDLFEVLLTASVALLYGTVVWFAWSRTSPQP